MDPIHRSHIIEYVLGKYVDEKSRVCKPYAAEPKQDVLTDFLTDLRHHCDEHTIDFDYSLRCSAMHWTEESIK